MNLRSTATLLLGLLMAVATACTKGTGPSFCPSDEIVVVSRQSNSGTYQFFKDEVLEKGDFRLGTLDLHGSKDVVDMVETTPCAIGYSGMGYKTEDVKFLKVAVDEGAPAYEPTIENVLSGDYPIARPLQLYTLGEPTGSIREYLLWILSPEGQKIVAKEGYVPLPEERRKALTAQIEKGGSTSGSSGGAVIQNTGSDTMLNLAQSWAEAYKKVRPEVSVEVAGGGSSVGIKDLIQGTVHIANASRKVKPSEIKQIRENTGKEAMEFIVAYDGIGVYIHKDNPLDKATLEKLAGIYGKDGGITRWSQLVGGGDGDSSEEGGGGTEGEGAEGAEDEGEAKPAEK